MQGGIRRKQDLLPRYKTGTGPARKGSMLTTPMKKLIVYILVLLTVYAVIRVTGITDRREITGYELEGKPASKPESVQGAEGAGVKGAKGHFNNEVAMQQEVENLNKNIDESEKAVSSSNKKNGGNAGAAAVVAKVGPMGGVEVPVAGMADGSGKNDGVSGNNVKAMKHNDKDIDEQAKRISDKAPYKKEPVV